MTNADSQKTVMEEVALLLSEGCTL